MRFLIFDTETSIRSKVYGADWRGAENDVYLFQYYDSAEKQIKCLYRADGFKRKFPLDITKFDAIVGANLKFDLGYFWSDPTVKDWIQSGGKLWDVLYAEYFISGQTHSYPSLSDLSKKYLKQDLKDKRIKALFKRKIGADVIMAHPRAKRLKALFLKYAKMDIEITHGVFLAQQSRAKPVLPTIKLHNSYLAVQLEEEANGVYINRSRLDKDKRTLYQTNLEIAADISDRAAKLGWEHGEFCFQSPVQLSLLLFGGGFPIQVKREVGKYKNGNTKFKLMKEEAPVTAVCPQFKKISSATKKPGIYSTTVTILNKILKGELTSDTREFITQILNYRRNAKIIGTYYENMEKYNVNGVIRQSYNNCATQTGRLSCASPNVQNQHKSVKCLYSSRFEAEGSLIELDWSQLEIRVLAFLSQDPVLTAELANNIDMHTETAKFLYSKNDITPEERKKAKALTFGLTYGEHYLTMSKRHELPEEMCENFVNFFYQKYESVKDWHDKIMADLSHSAELINKPCPIYQIIRETGEKIGPFTIPGEFQHRAMYISPTGKRYAHGDKGIYSGTNRANLRRVFHRPNVVNYPVQGTAAEVQAISQIITRDVLRKYAPDALLVNEVHDSRIIDCKTVLAKQIATEVIQAVIDRFPSMFKEYFGIDWNVPMQLDAKIGPNWEEMEDLH